MVSVKVKVARVHSDSKMPTKGSEFAAGWDLYSLEDTEVPFRKSVKLGQIPDIYPMARITKYYKNTDFGLTSHSKTTPRSVQIRKNAGFFKDRPKL